MEQCGTLIGLDVHKETITAAVWPPGAERVVETLKIPNTSSALEALVRRLQPRGSLAFVYEAGPCGYAVQRQWTALGQPCAVIAPALTPRRPGDRVKTDRRDAEKLARWYRTGELVVIHVPSRVEEAARDLVRVREDALEDRLRARHRLSTCLLRQGRVHRETKAWGVTHRLWLKGQRVDGVALQQTVEGYGRHGGRSAGAAGSAEPGAAGPGPAGRRSPSRCGLALSEGRGHPHGVDPRRGDAGRVRRFPTAAAFMSFTGLVPSEASSGARVQRGSMTKTGHAHLRRVWVEGAWCNRHGQVVSRELALRWQGAPPAVWHIARKAQPRLHRRSWRLVSRGKLHPVAVTAVARELAGFVWAMGQHVSVTA